MDKATTICCPFGEHRNCIIKSHCQICPEFRRGMVEDGGKESSFLANRIRIFYDFTVG